MSVSIVKQLSSALSQRIHILDGAYGTQLQALNLAEDDYRRERFDDHSVPLKGNYDLLSLSQPDAVAQAHRRYLRAGADIIKTNTFTSTRTAQADYALEDYVIEMNTAAAKIAQTHWLV